MRPNSYGWPCELTQLFCAIRPCTGSANNSTKSKSACHANQIRIKHSVLAWCFSWLQNNESSCSACPSKFGLNSGVSPAAHRRDDDAAELLAGVGVGAEAAPDRCRAVAVQRVVHVYLAHWPHRVHAVRHLVLQSELRVRRRAETRPDQTRYLYIYQTLWAAAAGGSAACRRARWLRWAGI